MTTLVPSFFDGSSSFLQVTRQTINPLMSFNFGKIPSLIFLILAGNKDNHKILDRMEIQPDQTLHCGVSCP